MSGYNYDKIDEEIITLGDIKIADELLTEYRDKNGDDIMITGARLALSFIQSSIYRRVNRRNTKIEQMADCERGHWYVTDSDCKGIVGISAPTKKEIEVMIPKAIEQMERLNR